MPAKGGFDRIASIDRRSFLQLSTLAAGASLPGLRTWGQQTTPAEARLVIDYTKPGKRIAADFTGLSYESAQLSDPQFFAGDNAQLIGLIPATERDWGSAHWRQHQRVLLLEGRS